MMMSLNAGSSLPTLPPEVWSNVFSFLFVKDLKSVRLTCHFFGEACNTFAIQKNEELVFSEHAVDTEAIKLLVNMKRKVWNIKLKWLDLIREPILPFFQKHGANICSLTLVECLDVDPEVQILPMIIEHCRSLRNFTVYFSTKKFSSNSDGIFAGFKTLQKNNIVRKSVESLTLIETYDKNVFQILNDVDFISIFGVFRNFKKLEIVVNTIEWFDEFSPNLFKESAHRLFTFKSLYYQLFDMRHQLEKLKLHLMYPIEEETHSAKCLHKISQIEMKNLKELSLNWTNLWDTYITNPFSRFNHLTEFKCFIGDSIPITKSAFILLLMDTQKKLRYLNLQTTKCFSIDKECFQALVTSHLTTLIIYPINELTSHFQNLSHVFHCNIGLGINVTKSPSITANFKQSSLKNSLLPNYTLKHLRANISDNNLLFLFSTYFRCLDDLKIHEVQESDITQ